MTESVIRALSGWDYAIIAFFFVFMASIGWLCRRLNRGVGDYFRGGGNMLWWVAGMTAMNSGLSAWAFTGGAAKCYTDGFVLPLTWVAGAPITLVISLLVAARFRRMRVMTAMEAVHRRFGTGTEQFYTWIALLLGLFFSAVGLNTLGVFMSSAFQTNLAGTIIGVGIVITVIAVFGGQWGMAASSFVQSLLMFLIVFVLVYLCVTLPQIGGASNLFSALPERHFRFGSGARFGIVWIWIGWNIIGNLLNPLDIRNAGRYVTVKDDRHAKLMVLMTGLPSAVLLLPLIMQLPSMVAAVVFPDMASIFPNLKNPEEGSYVAIAFHVLPQGLMGVLICGMFAASMDMPLNQYAGYIVRNIYLRFIRPDADDVRQLRIGKAVTLAFGAAVIGLGLTINALRTINLFDFFQLFNAMVLPPMGVPMALGMLFKRTPPWSGWSTVLFGLIVSIVAKATFSPQLVEHIMGYTEPLNAREAIDSQFVYVSVMTLCGSALWFFSTMLFYRKSNSVHQARIEGLFADFHRPIDRVKEEGQDQDAMQYRLIGALSMTFGGVMLLGMLIPNPMRGRMAFLFVGGIMFGIGLWLWVIYLRRRRLEAAAAQEPATMSVAAAALEPGQPEGRG